ncbi:Zn(2)-C6 fungal-type domain-containing protein [Pseudozyma hubeiensis]|nr:Zn(2)-C6 fungal-type domain-containing protein [Pseudozyma hubeiensis]
MTPGPSPNSIVSAPTASPSSSSKRDRSNTAEDPSAHAQADRTQKRTRVRQACNRCKARKIKCGDLRPCKNCTSLGLVCRDWRPGEEPYDQSAFAHPAGPSSSTISDNLADPWPSPDRHFRAHAAASIHSHTDRHPDRTRLSADVDARAERSGSEIPWPNTPYERSSHTVAWPPKPDPRRHRYLAYPYDSIYRNEFGHLKALSLSSGLGTLSYLHEYHKLANEQFLDALWQVLEGDNQDGVNMQLFALENESLSPHSHGSHMSSGLGAPTAAFTDSLAADWSLGSAPSLNVPFTFDAAAGPTPDRFPSMQIPTKPTLSVASTSSAETSPANAPPHANDANHSRSRSSTHPSIPRIDGSIAVSNDHNRPAKTYLDAGPPPEDLWAFMGTKIPQQHRRSLLHTFLSTTYVLWPTFILSEFLATLKDENERQNPTFVCLVIACCAIAARQEAGSTKGGHAAEWARSFGFFELYLDIRRLAPRNTDWASLNHIQALFYLSHHCFGASGPFGVTRAHYLMNGCVSKCFDVGLHRSAETYTDAFTPSEIEARRRTVWAVYCGDKISAAYGRPVMLRLSDMDVPELDVDSDEYTERLPAATSFDRACTLRPWHRAAIRLFCVLERVIDKINLPACSASAALERVMRKKPKRPRQSANHDESCMADHEAIGFEEELELVDDFRFADTPKPTSAHEDDPMYQAHVERLRTTAAFIKIFIFRHLFFSANLNLARQPPRIDYRDEMVKWCRELLLSQRKMIQRGDYTDFGSVMSYQLSQTGRGLIPAIYITSRLMDPSQDPNSNTILKEAQELLVLAYDLLRQLSDRFTASNRQLQIMQSAFRRLDLSLRKRHHKVGATGAHDASSHSHGAAERAGTQGGGAASSAGKEMTSGLDLIAGVAGAELLGSETLGESNASNEEEDEFEDDLDRDKKPGWISDLPINQPAEKTATYPASTFVGWPPAPAPGVPPRGDE